MRCTTLLASGVVAILAAPVAAQDFELDLSFDTGAAPQEETAAPTTTGGLQVSAILGFDATRSPLGDSTAHSLTLKFDDSRDIPGIGVLEWTGNIRYDDASASGKAQTWLDKFTIQNSAGNLSWTVGKFRIGWGELETVPVLDVINPALSISSIGADTSALEGQWMASAEYFGDGLTVSAFVGPDPQVEHAVPAASSRRQTELGLKADIPIEQGQVSFYLGRLVPQTGVVDITTMTSSARPYQLVGVSGHKALGSVLLEADLALKSGLERASAAGLSRHSRLDAGVGVEVAVTNSAQLTASITAQRWQGANAGYFDFGAAGPVAAKRMSAGYLVGYSDTFLNDNLALSANIAGDLDGGMQAGVLSADYSFSDKLKLSLTASRLHARAGSLFGALNGTRTLSVTAEYFF